MLGIVLAVIVHPLSFAPGRLFETALLRGRKRLGMTAILRGRKRTSQNLAKLIRSWDFDMTDHDEDSALISSWVDEHNVWYVCVKCCKQTRSLRCLKPRVHSPVSLLQSVPLELLCWRLMCGGCTKVRIKTFKDVGCVTFRAKNGNIASSASGTF